MTTLPSTPSKSTMARNPHLWPTQELTKSVQHPKSAPITSGKQPLLNKTETRFRDILKARGYIVYEQAFTLRLDQPFKSYRPDLAYIRDRELVFVEIKAPHRFARAGIAKAACAAKTYPFLRFELAMWTGGEWKESVLSP